MGPAKATRLMELELELGASRNPSSVTPRVLTTRRPLTELFLVSECCEALGRRLLPRTSVPPTGRDSAVASAVTVGVQTPRGHFASSP